MQTQTNPWQQRIFRLSLTLCVISFLLATFTIYAYWREKNQTRETAKNNARQEAVRAAKEIDNQLRKLQDSANSIAQDISKGKLKDQQLLERLKSTIEQNPNWFGVGAAYAPYTYNSQIRLYGPYYIRKQGKLQLLQLESFYDYTQPGKGDWYIQSLASGSVWLEPYFGVASNTFLAEFGTPFYRLNPKTKKNIPSGVVFANYSPDGLKDLMNSLKLGKTGYGFILSKKGTFIYSPIEDWVKEQKTIFQIISQGYKPEKLRVPAKKALKGSKIEMDFENPLTGQSSWIFFEPIPTTGWTLSAVFIQDEILLNTKSLHHKLLLINLQIISFLFFLFILLFRAYKGSVRSLWAVSSSTSVVLLAGIGFIWYLQISEHKIEQKNNIVLLKKAGLNKFLQSRKSENPKDSPLYIPTGVFVQSLEFEDANDVFITGYIWQKYDKNIPQNVSRGFILPEAVDPNVTEIHRHQDQNFEVILWYFEAKLRENFDYSKYPFDVKDVWIRLWPKDFYKNIILTPDFDAYDLMVPTSLPGLAEDFVLPGWNLKSSFFQYKLNNYNTNFGINSYIGQDNFPELYFTVVLQRNFINILISNMMIIIVVLLLLFCIQILIIKHKESGENQDFTALEIVSACGAFLFIIIIDQINLRQKIVTAGIIYLDYFYFILYIMILLVAINAILFASNIKLDWIDYKNNLIPKLLYWPTNLALLLLVTMLVF
ncbi:MAG: hypothetical protein DWQ53_10130 [Microcystis flos-aquae DF17]|nr:MAG: hypothetical protein DWQ53_10130 [Microcystis flos-aquae DF17]